MKMSQSVVQLLLKFLLFVVSAMHVSSSSAASSDQKIYQIVLNQVVKFDTPPRFAVWDSLIPSTTILSFRVPRHAPESQFTSMRGLPRKLQQRLLEAGDNDSSALTDLEVSFDSTTFIGFADKAAIQKYAEYGKGPDWLLAIGLSKVAYDKTVKNALVYVESCMVTVAPTCSGEGYWLVRTGKNWKLKKQTSFWQGSAQPFWTFDKGAR